MTALPRPHRILRRAVPIGTAAAAGMLAAVATVAAAATDQPLATLLDEGYEIIAVTDAGDRNIDLVYLRKGKSHVVCRYVPFSPDWTPLGESTCLPMNYATE